MSETRETALKRLRMRSWRRGMKEMDLILGPFADSELARLGGGEMALYGELLSENDQDLYFWIAGAGADAVPSRFEELIGRLRAFHAIA
jgi:antitoxin CptB